MSSDETENIAENEPVGDTPPWCKATPEDLLQIENLGFESPIEDLTSSDCYHLSESYYRHTKDLEKDTATYRIFTMLGGVCSMGTEASRGNDPFSAQLVWADGTRSALTEDFRGAPLETLKIIAPQAKSAVLRARACHVCWVLDRKLGKLGIEAVNAYLELIKQLKKHKLDGGEIDENGEHRFLDLKCRDFILLAAHIAWKTGWDSDHGRAVKEEISELFRSSLDGKRLVSIHWFGEISLIYGVIDGEEIAAAIEDRIRKGEFEGDVHVQASLQDLIARCYRKSQNTPAANLAQRKASDCYADAAANGGSPMLVSHFLSCAISRLHGLPDQRDRRKELNHRLIDAQADIFDEMQPIGHSINIEDLVANTKESCEGLDLLDLLFRFAVITASPCPDDLEKQAQNILSQSPLSSLFPQSFHNERGRVVHRSPAAGFSQDASLEVLRPIIVQNEEIRRSIDVGGNIEVARQYIGDKHYISSDMLYRIFRHSPLVPDAQVATFCDGFTKFFHGDFIGALYVLTPLLESSLRHYLELRGYPATKFDDATQTQEDYTISGMFNSMRSELESCFTKSIVADIENVFLLQPRPRIRHGVAHGSLLDGAPCHADAIYACWRIYSICLIPLFPIREQIREHLNGIY